MNRDIPLSRTASQFGGATGHHEHIAQFLDGSYGGGVNDNALQASGYLNKTLQSQASTSGASTGGISQNQSRYIQKKIQKSINSHNGSRNTSGVMHNTDGPNFNDYTPNPYLMENTLGKKTMERFLDQGIKDVYHGLNENSSSTLQAMGTMYTEQANTNDHTDRESNPK